MRSWLIISIIVIAAVLGVRGMRNIGPSDPHALLRDSIAVLRTHAESCRAEVDRGAEELRRYDRQLDSMRARVREMETLDRRVPADSYAPYISAFNAYNDSAAAWPPREDSVRALEARCRAIAEEHNALTDSLRSLVLPAESRRY